MATAGGTYGYISKRTDTSVTRENEFTRTELTNIQTKADTWGKVIPIGFGRHRVAGALVWASDFYSTVSGFDTRTTVQDVYTTWDVHSGNDAVARGAGIFDIIADPPKDEFQPPRSQVVSNRSSVSSIDLCYSFGKEGDPRKTRFVDKIRINDTLAYDSSTGFLAPGLAFTVRPGTSDDIPAIMQGYDTGIYHYKGQTLVVFEKFPTANYGDAIPSSVDVEFGCDEGCGFEDVNVRVIGRLNTDRDRIKAGTINFKSGMTLVAAICRQSGWLDARNEWVAQGWTNQSSYLVVGVGTVDLYYLQITSEAQAQAMRSQDIQLVTPHDPNQTIEDYRISGWLYYMQTHIKSGNPFSAESVHGYIPGVDGNNGESPPAFPVLVPAVACVACFMFDKSETENARAIGPNVETQTTTSFGIQQFWQTFQWGSDEFLDSYDLLEFRVENCKTFILSKFSIKYNECGGGGPIIGPPE